MRPLLRERTSSIGNVLSAVTLLLLSAASGCTEDPPTTLAIDPGDQTGTLDTGEGERRFVLHVPPGLTPGDPCTTAGRPSRRRGNGPGSARGIALR